MSVAVLRDLQIEVQRYLMDPERSPEGLRALILDAPPLPLAERAAIYKSGYRSRLVDALADTHPVLFKVLGDEDFADAAVGFIDSLPSTHRSIRWYGREFSGYLANRAPFDAQPILAELAAFEWTLAEVFDAPDAPHIDRGVLQAMPPDAWGELRLRFHPSVRRLTLRWNTVAAWRAMSRDEAPPEPGELETPGDWLLWRQDFRSQFRSLEADEAAAFDGACRGEPFAAVCAALAPHAAAAEVPLRAAIFMANWIDGGIVSGAASAGDAA